MQWPDGFLWGTGTSSTQCEDAAPASDWWDWQQAGHAPVSGDGNGFATPYAEGFGILARLGLTHHRLSIEWARIEPDEGTRERAWASPRGSWSSTRRVRRCRRCPARLRDLGRRCGRGFFHWTAVDNDEWRHGYDVAFGIRDRDRNVKPSAGVLAREALGTT